LLIVPKDLISQWELEINDRIRDTTNILVHRKHFTIARRTLRCLHKPCLEKSGTQADSNSTHVSPEALAEADVVITTYETLRLDFNELVAAKESFLKSHHKPFCGHYPLLAVF
jgi:ornithine cyclodeaminase/alanine dehydrogenase-like protein (mu-crystallin family)